MPICCCCFCCFTQTTWKEEKKNCAVLCFVFREQNSVCVRVLMFWVRLQFCLINASPSHRFIAYSQRICFVLLFFCAQLKSIFCAFLPSFMYTFSPFRLFELMPSIFGIFSYTLLLYTKHTLIKSSIHSTPNVFPLSFLAPLFFEHRLSGLVVSTQK